MNRLNQAKKLFEQPFTVKSLLELDNLIMEAQGEEAEALSQLWCIAIACADEQVYLQALDRGLV
ncbi:hypothetical protein [Thaumasiovibrio subtropicus]|uniref:hypothetical protein n=1 Tax=Thaumasiovibrio subtropicus TaxID=1891207 RepID=UPI000B353396|nr:hypothetical protein [Thaumasiovibrio subtropicus]